MTPYHFSYVYILQSIRFPHQIYIGFTRNLRKRYSEHNDGTSSSTKRYMPWRLAYYEAFSHEHSAREREEHLKSNGNPMRELKKRIGLTENMKSGKGFTLIEALVAVTIITISIVGPLAAANSAVVAARMSSDKLTASYLAQEGIEYMRAIRDGNYLTLLHTPPYNTSNAWNNFISAVTQCDATPPNTTMACTYDPVDGLSNCIVGSTCAQLYLENANGIYKYRQGPGAPGVQQTIFTRTLQIKDVTGNDKQIISKVSWNFHGAQYFVTIYDHLTPWQ